MPLKALICALLITLPAAAASAECRDHPKCPEGTQMNNDTHQCVPISS